MICNKDNCSVKFRKLPQEDFVALGVGIYRSFLFLYYKICFCFQNSFIKLHLSYILVVLKAFKIFIKARALSRKMEDILLKEF